jgi:hypothetical protein
LLLELNLKHVTIQQMVSHHNIGFQRLIVVVDKYLNIIEEKT